MQSVWANVLARHSGEGLQEETALELNVYGPVGSD